MLGHVASWGDRRPHGRESAKAELLVNQEPAAARPANFAGYSLQFDRPPDPALSQYAAQSRIGLTELVLLSALLVPLRMRSPITTY